MPKIVDKEKMRTLILNASLKVFLKNGFQKSTMDLIATKANVAKGTLYLYFNSKDELISELTKEHFESLKLRMVKQEYFLTIENLLLHIKSVLMINKKSKDFIPLFFEVFGKDFRNTDFTKRYKKLFLEIGIFFEKNINILQQKKLIDENISAKSFSKILVSMMDGVILHKGFFNPSNKSYKQMTDEFIILIKKYLTS